MADRDKVIKGLEICLKIPGFCKGCPYGEYDSSGKQNRDCLYDLRNDAIALLKEHERQEKALKTECLALKAQIANEHKTIYELSTKIVRCKECKWYDPFPMCGLLGTSDITEDFFCADGERKEKNGET